MMNNSGRVTIVGFISGYNLETPEQGIYACIILLIFYLYRLRINKMSYGAVKFMERCS